MRVQGPSRVLIDEPSGPCSMVCPANALFFSFKYWCCSLPPSGLLRFVHAAGAPAVGPCPWCPLRTGCRHFAWRRAFCVLTIGGSSGVMLGTLCFGVINSCGAVFIPVAVAMLLLEAGFTSLTCTTPLFTALSGWAWYRYPLSPPQCLTGAWDSPGCWSWLWTELLSGREAWLGRALGPDVAACFCSVIAAHYLRDGTWP